MMGLSAWIKFIGYEPPAIAMLVLLGLGLIYFLMTHAEWVDHISNSEQHSPLNVRADIFAFTHAFRAELAMLELALINRCTMPEIRNGEDHVPRADPNLRMCR